MLIKFQNVSLEELKSSHKFKENEKIVKEVLKINY